MQHACGSERGFSRRAFLNAKKFNQFALVECTKPACAPYQMHTTDERDALLLAWLFVGAQNTLIVARIHAKTWSPDGPGVTDIHAGIAKAFVAFPRCV